MAFILVLILHRSEAHSSIRREIVVLHVQSKPTTNKAAMQPLHGARQNFVIFFITFQRGFWKVSQYLRRRSLSASAKFSGQRPGSAGNPLADVPFSC
ncbi:hypothetical protein [Tabrizicola thermarum]|uniref:hypothetical protein n=1 Tax=Tabrizicola thermarum TaxID=2670345 RepID=UPI000FFCC44E|nr:hypothetical protein [Tabrizicola thermarum]